MRYSTPPIDIPPAVDPASRQHTDPIEALPDNRGAVVVFPVVVQ